MNTVSLNWFTNDKQFPFFIQYGGHKEDTILHTHDDFTELVIVLNGNETHIVNSESYFIKKGNVFVINEGTPHAYVNPHDFTICNMMFRPEILLSAGPDLRSSNGFQALFVLEPLYRNIHSFQSRLSLSIPSMEHVSSIISVMINEYNDKLQGYQTLTLLISRFMELVVYFSRQYDSQENGTDSNLMHLANALSYIEDHYLEPLTLEEIAADPTFRSGIWIGSFNLIIKRPPFPTCNDFVWSARVCCSGNANSPSLISHTNAGLTTAIISRVSLPRFTDYPPRPIDRISDDS